MTVLRRPISIAFSPDTDDAFMVHAMRMNKLDLPDCAAYDFSYTAADIQQLNEAARLGRYDVTAISAAAYPSLAASYYLMPIGASIGDQFGPALVVSNQSQVRSPDELQGRRIAVPGRQTSAFFAARGLIGDFEEVPMSFTRIADAVLAGEVDAGILIHELQLNPESQGLRRLGDLGSLWWNKWQLPLPLGANAIRRDLGGAVIGDITKIMRASIEAGLKDRQATLTAALAEAGKEKHTGLDLAGGDRYISMYVNQRSLALQPDVKAGLAKLYAIGRAGGLCNAVDMADALYE